MSRMTMSGSPQSWAVCDEVPVECFLDYKRSRLLRFDVRRGSCDTAPGGDSE